MNIAKKWDDVDDRISTLKDLEERINAYTPTFNYLLLAKKNRKKGNPWLVIAGVAFVQLLLGCLLALVSTGSLTGGDSEGFAAFLLYVGIPLFIGMIRKLIGLKHSRRNTALAMKNKHPECPTDLASVEKVIDEMRNRYEQGLTSYKSLLTYQGKYWDLYSFKLDEENITKLEDDIVELMMIYHCHIDEDDVKASVLSTWLVGTCVEIILNRLKGNDPWVNKRVEEMLGRLESSESYILISTAAFIRYLCMDVLAFLSPDNKYAAVLSETSMLRLPEPETHDDELFYDLADGAYDRLKSVLFERVANQM